jgi:hypothetical protein
VANSGAPDLDLMAAALQEFDRQCAAGDDTSLELRASALLVLGRHVAAARTIDAFLRRRPLSTLPAQVRARIEGNLPLFFARVGSIRVVTNAPNALARIGEAEPEPVDGRLLRVEPGTVHVSVWAPGALSPVTQAIAVDAGQIATARFTLEPARSPAIHERHAVSELPLSSGAAPSVPIASAPRAEPEDAESTELHLAPWAVTAGVLGGMLLAAGGVAVAIHFERADLYESEGCPEKPFMPGCEDVLGEFELAGTLRTAFFIAGGVLAAASLALVIVDAAIGGADAREDESGVVCAAAGPELAIACRARF